MSAELHTFFDIFSAEFDLDGESVRLQSIVIPKIQRDYAQGRKDAEVNRVRKRFLSALKAAILGTNITLDFVYGNIDENGRMTPLDGQQRLTTLFLLHVYAAKKAGVRAEEYAFLNHFSYETRYSARDFCSALVNKYTPSFKKTITDEIMDQAWFPLDWQKDPTISSMLVMLDVIHEQFAEVPNLWERLKEGAISFYLLLLKDMGLSDEVYIKMNSRGKPLTRFEHFKAELEQTLREVDKALSEEVMYKIDRDWTDMLWHYHGKDNIVDDEFLGYFRFVCDILCYQAGQSPLSKSGDEFDLLSEYFSKDSVNSLSNIRKMISMFDCWCDLGDMTPAEFMGRFISEEHQENKVKLAVTDIFEDCLKNYADILGNGNRSFPMNRIILLFAVVTYLQNKEGIAEKEFVRRLRIVNNLVQNSEEEISVRTGRNRIPAILQQVETIIVSGTIDLSIKNALNATQLNEEVEKEAWLKSNADKAESLFELEDHDLLYGQISIVGLDHADLFPRFHSLFACEWDLVDCALMTIGVYAQPENRLRYQMGSGFHRQMAAWRTLFHKSQAIGNGPFSNTKNIICTLLQKAPVFNNEILQELIDTFIAECESKSVFPIQYYYVKYPHFRPRCYGKYLWNDLTNKPYEMSVLLTAKNWSESTYQPFLKTIDDAHLHRESKGQKIVLEAVYVSCENDAYVIAENETDKEIDRIVISQNEEGMDTEDRLIKLKNSYAHIIEQNKRLVNVANQ